MRSEEKDGKEERKIVGKRRTGWKREREVKNEREGDTHRVVHSPSRCPPPPLVNRRAWVTAAESADRA